MSDQDKPVNDEPEEVSEVPEPETEKAEALGDAQAVVDDGLGLKGIAQFVPMKNRQIELLFGPRIKLEVFEGPLDLLLYLIRKNEYDIFDIPVSAITEQYLGYIEAMQNLNLEVAGEFIVMAATLMKIKSRMLLPRPEPEDDEEEGEDPRAALVRQLLEYQRFKEAADALAEKNQLDRDVFARKFPNPELISVVEEESQYLEVDIYELIEAMRSVLRNLPEKAAHLVQMEPYSVRERMGQVIEMMRGRESITFTELFAGVTERIEVVTTFLALLELVRLQMARVYQAELRGTIRIMPLVKDIDSEEGEALESASAYGEDDRQGDLPLSEKEKNGQDDNGGQER